MNLLVLKLFFHLMGGFSYRLGSDLIQPRLFRIMLFYKLRKLLGLGMNLRLLRRTPFFGRRLFLMRRMPLGMLGHHLFGGSGSLNDLFRLGRLLLVDRMFCFLLLRAFRDRGLSSRRRLCDRLLL
jgi:hypothetical protein